MASWPFRIDPLGFLTRAGLGERPISRGGNRWDFVNNAARRGRRCGAAVVATTTPGMAWAQNEQFIAGLIYRTGAYAPNGIRFANGIADYYALINARDGGASTVSRSATRNATRPTLPTVAECYERLKNKGPTGTAHVAPLSTGITFCAYREGANRQDP